MKGKWFGRLFFVVCLSAAAWCQATSLTWDTVPGDGGMVTGGAGSWMDGAGNWNDGAGNVNWSNANPDLATFGDAGGTVTLGGAVTVGTVAFNAAGYLVTGDTLTLAGGVVTNDFAAEIASVIAGSAGLTKRGSGVLTITASETYAGATAVNGGSLRIGTSLLPPPANLVHRWSFSGNANDSIGSMHLTTNSGVTISGGLANFDGTFGTSYLMSASGNDIAAISAANQAVSIEFWGTFQSNVYWARVYDIGINTANYIFHNTGDAATSRTIIKTGGGESGIFTGPVLLTGSMIHVVDVYDQANNTISTYTNGVLAVSAGMGGQSLANIGTNNFYLGKSHWNDPYLKGSLTEVRIYNSALTAAQVASNYVNGAEMFGYAAAGQMPATTPVTVGAGAAFDLNSTVQSVASLSGPAGSSVQLGSGLLTVDSAADTVFAGVLSDGGGASGLTGGRLTKKGTGTFTLTGINTLTGAVTVDGGTLYANIGNAANNRVFSLVSGITVKSNATLRTTVNGLFGWDGAQTRPITINAGGTLVVDTRGDCNVGLVTLNGGTLAGGPNVDYWGSWSFGRGTDKKLAVTADSTVSATNVVFFNGATVDVAAGKTLTFNGTIDNSNNGASALIKTGAGTMVLSSTNGYTGATIVRGGALILTNAASINGNANVVVGENGGETGILTLSDNVALTCGALMVWNGTGTITVNTGTVNATGWITLGQYGGVGVINQNGGTVTTPTLWTSFRGIGTYNLNGGTFAVGGFLKDIGTGVIRFNGGTLRATADWTLGDGNVSAVEIRNGAAVVDSNGRNIAISKALAHSTIGGDNAKDGGLTKSGAGTLTLSGGNTYTGDTVVQNGTLKIAAPAALPAGSAVTLVSGSTLEIATNGVSCASLGGAGTLKVLTDKPLAVTGTLDATLAIELADPESLDRSRSYVLATCSGYPTSSFTLVNVPSVWKVRADEGKLVLFVPGMIIRLF